MAGKKLAPERVRAVLDALASGMNQRQAAKRWRGTTRAFTLMSCCAQACPGVAAR